MRVTKAFQPITIIIETKEEAQIIEEALSLLLSKVQTKGGSWWAGWKNEQLKPEQMHYRAEINRIRFALNPDLKERPMFLMEHA